MKKYEMVREIFNACSGNQMRDVFIDEIETDDMEATVKQFLVGTEVQCERLEKDKGAIFNINTDGLQQRVTFTAV
jgi:hypothetical protein